MNFALERDLRTADTARIGAGQVRRGNQGVRGQRAALIGSQHLALPFTGPPVRANQAGARHRDLGPPEGSCQRPCPMTVPVTDTKPSLLLSDDFGRRP